MSDLSIPDRDTLAFAVNVKHVKSGARFDLTDATVEVIAGQNGIGSLTGTVTVPIPATGRIVVSFPAAALGVGAWTVEVVVTSGTETQTVRALTVNVTQSLAEP